jgi:hypothetical protein
MKKAGVAIWLGLALVTGTSSCGMHYASVTPSAPLLSRAGDVAVSVNASSGVGVAGSIAFAVHDRLSLLVEGSTLGNNTDTINYLSQYYRSFGAALGTQFRYNQSLQGDLYCGLANASSLFDGHGGMIGIISDSGRANVRSIFIQSAVGLSIDEEDPTDIFAYQLRLSYLSFRDFFSLRQYRFARADDREMYLGHRDVLLSEHSFFIRVGPPNYKLTSFITIPRSLFGATDNLFLEGAIGVGLEFRHNMFDLMD